MKKDKVFKNRYRVPVTVEKLKKIIIFVLIILLFSAALPVDAAIQSSGTGTIMLQNDDTTVPLSQDSNFDTLLFEPNSWNLVSVPRTMENWHVEIVFSNLSLDANNIKWYYRASKNEWEHPSDIMPLRGYWVYNNASSQIPQQLNYKNRKGASVSPSMLLKEGWNLIGHTSTQPMSVSSALVSIEGKYSHLLSYSPSEGWKMYIVGNPALQQFSTFEPGRGYWIFMTKDATYAAVDI